MIAINHALTGAIIGLTVHNPVVAVAAALLSHLLCDMIPHFGLPDRVLRQSKFAAYLLVDALSCLLLVVILFVSQTPNWLLASVCAFVATTPDLVWIRQYAAARQRRQLRLSGLERFLKRIQWFEHPIGALVELTWAGAAVVILSNIL